MTRRTAVAVALALLCTACAVVVSPDDEAAEGLALEDASSTPAPPAVDVSSVMGPGWQPYRLPGKRLTTYRVSDVDGVAAVRADASRSASMLRRQVRVAPQALGRIQFSWWVPRLMAQARLRKPASADSPVRLVLAFEGDSDKLSLRHRLVSDLAHTLTGESLPYATLMYVWDNEAALEEVIPDARTDRIRKIVVDSGPRGLRSWRLHERDVAADFRRAFGEEPGPLVGVALMSDSDNTASDIHAFYGPVHLAEVARLP